MLVDIYGSRAFMINMLNFRKDLNFDIDRAFIGTNFSSQLKRNVAIKNNVMDRFLSDFEKLEIETDSKKTFRKFHVFSKSNIIFIDLSLEGKSILKEGKGALMRTPSLKRLGIDVSNATHISFDERINKLDDITDTFKKYLSTYDLVVLNRTRQHKLKKTIEGIVIKDDYMEVNFQNFYTETFEDLLISKMDNLIVIPKYDTPDNLVDGYYFDKSYTKYLKKNIEETLKNYVR